MAIYMKFGAVNGAVTTKGFEKWIELESVQWGVGRSVGSAARGSTARESSEPSISEVSITKQMDVSSNALFADAVGGDFSTKVSLKFTTTTKDHIATFLHYELSDTGISGFSTSSGGQAPTEALSLNFTKIMITYTGHDVKIGGAPDTVGYDLTKMAKV